MHRVAALAVLSLVLAAPAVAQTAQVPPRRFQPPPDHWMTIDSLSQTLGLTSSAAHQDHARIHRAERRNEDAAVRRQAIASKCRPRLHARSGNPLPTAREVRQCTRRAAGVSG